MKLAIAAFLAGILAGVALRDRAPRGPGRMVELRLVVPDPDDEPGGGWQS